MSALTQIEDTYNEYLNFIEVLESKTTSKEMYYEIGSFLTSSYGASSVLIYGISSLNSHVVRCVWNRKKISGEYSKKDIGFITKFITDKNSLDKFGHQSIDRGEYNIYISNLGKDQNQNLYMVYKIPKETHFTLDKRLHCSAFNSQIKMNEYNTISKLKELIHIDDVSGLFNQRKFILDIEDFIDRYFKIKEAFCVVFIDIDHFKSVNDNYGHLVGTKLLEEVGNVFKGQLREDDMSYRYGGDEFVALIPDGDIECANSISERILKTIAEHTFSFKIGNQEKVELNLSVSIGIAAFPDDAKTKEDIITFADRMMYMAKESGRGRVCLASSVVSQDDDADSNSK